MMDETSSYHHQQLNMLTQFWRTQLQLIETGEPDFKNYQLPLARIKKVMKTDDDVKPMMISAEAPMVFAKACEIFVLELTLRAWLHTEESKRRTLQRNDVAAAVSKNDAFDFLIDVVPREEQRLRRPGPEAEFGQNMMGAGALNGAPNPLFYTSDPNTVAATASAYPQMMQQNQEEQQSMQTIHLDEENN